MPSLKDPIWQEVTVISIDGKQSALFRQLNK